VLEEGKVAVYLCDLPRPFNIFAHVLRASAELGRCCAECEAPFVSSPGRAMVIFAMNRVIAMAARTICLELADLIPCFLPRFARVLSQAMFQLPQIRSYPILRAVVQARISMIGLSIRLQR
jgi:hypothetical protein